MLFAIGLDDPAARTVNRSEELRLMAWDEDTQSLGGSRGAQFPQAKWSSAVVAGLDAHQKGVI